MHVTSVERLQHRLRAGLDTLNHSAARNCYWKVQGCLTDTSATIELKALRGLKPGTEACIAYEQESNEAMMFRYGFVELNNAEDAVMLRCPLGPTEEWDEVMHKKVELLQVCFNLYSVLAASLSASSCAQLDSGVCWRGLVGRPVVRDATMHGR